MKSAHWLAPTAQLRQCGWKMADLIPAGGVSIRRLLRELVNLEPRICYAPDSKQLKALAASGGDRQLSLGNLFHSIEVGSSAPTIRRIDW